TRRARGRDEQPVLATRVHQRGRRRGPCAVAVLVTPLRLDADTFAALPNAAAEGDGVALTLDEDAFGAAARRREGGYRHCHCPLDAEVVVALRRKREFPPICRIASMHYAS